MVKNEIRQRINERFAELRGTKADKKLFKDIANEYGVGLSTVRRICLNLNGYSVPLEVSGTDDASSDDEFIKGTSTLYDAEGKIRLKWVKTDNKFDLRKIRECMETLATDLPQCQPQQEPSFTDDDVLSVYPMGDPHLGLYAWAAETGDDFDLDIAERDLCGAVERLVRCTPPSTNALIANLGDFFHADNMMGETMRSHHKLDTDTRWAKVLGVGLKAIRKCIHTALERHKHVTVINAVGNHDDHSSMFLTVALSAIYENEPRVTIVDTPTFTHYYHFGQNLLGVHHGHSIKAAELPLVMARERPEEWYKSNTRMWLCGHIHHESKKEYQGVIVETFRTLAARDAWATSMGYYSGRDMKAIVFHKTNGEVERHTVNVSMLRNMTPTGANGTNNGLNVTNDE